MKTWEKPELSTLGVEKTASGWEMDKGDISGGNPNCPEIPEGITTDTHKCYYCESFSCTDRIVTSKGGIEPKGSN